MFSILISAVFVLGYFLITLEHKWNLHKAITAAALGGFLWFLIALHEKGEFVGDTTSHLGADIFSLIIFLLAAMTIIEVMAHYRFFDFIKSKILKLGFNDYKQFWVISGLAFFLSAILDNLTTTIVMIEISRSFFRGRNLTIAAASVVIAANAGGAWSPIGDVTTIMLWLADKFTAFEIISWVFLPSLALALVSTTLLSFRIRNERADYDTEVVTLAQSEKVVIIVCLLSFLLPVAFSQYGLEPYFGLLFGLGLVGLLIALFQGHTKCKLASSTTNQNGDESHAGLDTNRTNIPAHLTVDFEKKLARVDLASLLFFSGILLAVGALEHLGILHLLSTTIFGDHPSFTTMVVGNTLLGVFSAIIDNIPLTAAAMTIITSTDPAIWTLLALAAGTGGSLLVIGSAAGVVAMGRVKELSFGTYIKIATLPALAGYAVAIGVWVLQYVVVR